MKKPHLNVLTAFVIKQLCCIFVIDISSMSSINNMKAIVLVSRFLVKCFNLIIIIVSFKDIPLQRNDANMLLM